MQIDRADNFVRSLGTEAYRVGGSVRDELLERKAKDADYMVRGVDLHTLRGLMAAKLTFARIKGDVTPIIDRRGQQFGWRAAGVEIALPRREENAGSGRAQVIVADPNISVYDDAKRRDFTFNALYKIISHPDGLANATTFPNGTAVENVLDPTGRGLFDLQRGFIQTTHPDSFRDDPLRTLRALRFVARGFSLTSDTREQMSVHADRVDGLSANGYASGTVLDEMSKILLGDRVAEALRIARDTGVLAALFPELVAMLGFDQGSRFHDLTTDEHTFSALATAAKVDAPLRVRWALLFHDAGKPETAWVGPDGRTHYYEPPDDVWYAMALADGMIHQSDTTAPPKPPDHEIAGERIWRKAAERIGAPRDLREDVATLVRNHMVPLDGKFKASKVRQGRVRFGDSILRDLYLHRACDISGKGKPDKQAMERIARMEQERGDARVAGVPAKVGDLEVNGHDAMEVGLRGAEIGSVLKTILREVASQPNERSRSREWQMLRLEALFRGLE